MLFVTYLTNTLLNCHVDAPELLTSTGVSIKKTLTLTPQVHGQISVKSGMEPGHGSH